MAELVAATEDSRGPFQNVFMLECEQMKRLIGTIQRSLHELGLGFAGELTMSEEMDTLMLALFLDRVPATWSRIAWPSMRPLASWLVNLQARVAQLMDWTSNPTDIPRVTWISGLINPQSFLTAVMQQTAQRNSQELDKLVIQTEFTKLMLEEADALPRDSVHIHGMFLQGARWDVKAQLIGRSLPREMYCVLPIVNVRAVAADKADEKAVYMCPVYKTEQRGPTFVFRAQLRTKSPPARWLMAGVAVILDIVL